MDFLILATVLFQEETESVGVPGWVPIVIAVIVLLLFWWGLTRNSIPQGPTADADDGHDELEETAVSSDTATVPIDEVDEAPAKPDNLKEIEGIGPKIEGVLHDAGIRTFAQLAAASVSQLEKIVRQDAGIRVAFPDTWPEQAGLAANNQWAELEELQDNLKGGRRA